MIFVIPVTFAFPTHPAEPARGAALANLLSVVPPFVTYLPTADD